MDMINARQCLLSVFGEELNKGELVMKICFTLCLFIGLFVNLISFSNDFLEDDLKELYQFQNWAGSTKTNYVHVIQNWTTDISTYGATNFFINPKFSNGLIIGPGDCFFQPTNMLDSVRLRIVESPSVLDAHIMMMQFFDNCSAKQPFQTGESIGVKLGDHCYAGYPIGTTNSLFFVRNNMFIFISSGEPPESVYDIANKIDQQLLKLSLSPP